MFQAFFVEINDINGPTTNHARDESPHESYRDRLGCKHGASRVVLVFPISFSNKLVSSYFEKSGCFFGVLRDY